MIICIERKFICSFLVLYTGATSLLSESITDIKSKAKAAEIYLKSRLFSYNSNAPKLDKKAAKNRLFDYWSFKIKEIDTAEVRSCKTRVNKGYSVHIDAYLTDLIYYVDGLSEKIAQLHSNEKGTYKVTWRISHRFREYFYPEYKLLSDLEKKELIAQGKFYPFFLQELEIVICNITKSPYSFSSSAPAPAQRRPPTSSSAATSMRGLMTIKTGVFSGWKTMAYIAKLAPKQLGLGNSSNILSAMRIYSSKGFTIVELTRVAINPTLRCEKTK